MTWLLHLLYGGRPHVLLIRRGRVELWKGKILHSTVAAVQDVVEASGQSCGVVYRGTDGRWGFSPGIAPEVRQRLRNVLTGR